MKKLYLLLISLVLTSSTLFGQSSFTYTIELRDSWGDGWTGNRIDVLVNGSVVLDDLTILSGSGPNSYSFNVDYGDIITTDVYNGGSFPGDGEYQIKNELDEVVAQSGQNWAHPGNIEYTVTYGCPEDIEIDNDQGVCGAEVIYIEPAPAGATVTQIDESGLTSGDIFPIGITIQEYEIDWTEGDKDTCSFNITVNDNEAPVIDCPGDIEVELDPESCDGAVVSFGKITFSENFTQGEISPHAAAWADFRSQLLSTYNYTKLTMKGTYDPVGVSITDPVEILNIANALREETDYLTNIDGLNWVVGSCTGPIELYAGASHSATCYCTNGEYTVRPALNISSAWGGINTNSCNAPSQTMTVEFEIAGGEITASDNCSVNVVQTEGLPSGSEFPIGTTTNTFKATDASGNTSYCSFNVTVNDIPPVLVVHPLEIELYQNGEYVLNSNDIEAISAGTTDNCDDYEDLLITVSPKSFECVHVGEPIDVKVTATDKSGESSSAWTTVTVYDETPPVALCKDLNIVLDEDGEARINPSKVNAGDGTVTPPGWARTYNDLSSGSYDACGISLLNIDQYNFDCSNIGENTVTLTVVDAHGNTSTCESTVTVSDNMVPVIKPVANVELVIEPGNCDAELEYPTLVVHDNCETTLELTAGFGPDGMFPVGTTTETWKATDDAGNTASVSFEVTIVATNAMPTVDEPTDVTVVEDTYSVEVTLTGISEGIDCEEQEISVTAAGDNPELITAVTVDYTSGDSTGTVEMMIAPEMSGEAEIIVTVEDEEGGTATDTFMVTVTAVNDAPYLVAPISDQTVNADHVLKVPVSSVLGELFDDIDDEMLTIEVMAEGTDSLPHWAMIMGDTLVCTPLIADTGCVNIVVTATDAGGLSASDTFEICVDGFPVSIGELGLDLLEIQMYPNPTRGIVNLEMSSGVYEVLLSVHDITGKVVLRKQYSVLENITFDMSEKVSGMYFVRMNIDGNQIVKKLIVDRK